MATIKAFTDLEQSRKLAEILPLESADMFYWCADHYPKEDWIIEVGAPDDNYECIYAWSLAALLNILNFPSLTQNKEDEWEVCVPNCELDEYIEVSAVNPIDACVEMIEKLNELNML